MIDSVLIPEMEVYRLLSALLPAITDHPDQVVIDFQRRPESVLFKVFVSPEDFERLSSTRGRLENSLITVFDATGKRDSMNFELRLMRAAAPVN